VKQIEKDVDDIIKKIKTNPNTHVKLKKTKKINPQVKQIEKDVDDIIKKIIFFQHIKLKMIYSSIYSFEMKDFNF